jgi:hypothetical protein
MFHRRDRKPHSKHVGHRTASAALNFSFHGTIHAYDCASKAIAQKHVRRDLHERLPEL